MPLTQLEAVTGRRIRPNYTSLINSQLPYLPAIKARQDALKHQETMEQQAQDRLALESRVAKQQRQDASKARTLGYVGLGVNTGLAAAPYLSDMFKSEAASTPSSGFNVGVPDSGVFYSGTPASGPQSWTSKFSNIPVLGQLASGGEKLYNIGSEALGDIGSFFSGLFS